MIPCLMENSTYKVLPMQVANSWRTTGDISPNWESMLRCLDNTIGLSEYAKPVRAKGFWIFTCQVKRSVDPLALDLTDANVDVCRGLGMTPTCLRCELHNLNV